MIEKDKYEQDLDFFTKEYEEAEPEVIIQDVIGKKKSKPKKPKVEEKLLNVLVPEDLFVKMKTYAALNKTTMKEMINEILSGHFKDL